MKAVVIGAGLGGLATAIRLAHAGYEVEVFEQSDSAGGKAGELRAEGFRFDMGPTIVTMPFIIMELFNDINKNISDYLQFTQLTTSTKYFYPDDTTINAYQHNVSFAQEIARTTEDSVESVYLFFAYARKIYELSEPVFLRRSLGQPETFMSKEAVKSLFRLRDLDTKRTMHEAISSFFNDPKTIQLFDRYATYNGSNPYQAPATLNIISHVENRLGTYVLKGGMYVLVRALEQVALEKGVTVHYNTPVQSILIDSRSVTGIEIPAGTIKAGIVVSNVDVNVTYQKLLNDTSSQPAKKYAKLELSTSALVFFWGVRKDEEVAGASMNMEIHNILFSENYREEFQQLFIEKIYPDDLTVYLYISSKFVPGDAPEGFENWYVMVNAPYVNSKYANEYQDEEELLESLKTRILHKIHKVLGIDLSSKIVFEERLSPQMIASKTGSFLGSLYGISSNSRFSAFLRQHNRSNRYNGLYFCGGSAHPGGGIPLVLLSGKIAADLVMKYHG